MLSSKEALDKLCDLATPNGECLNYVIGLGMAIKQALERLEQLEEENQQLKEEINELSKDELCFEKRCDKFEKVIEILKELGNLYLVKEVNGKDIYYAIVFNGLHSYLEENEYKLLKEVLGE